jgi:hypothetical protein
VALKPPVPTNEVSTSSALSVCGLAAAAEAPTAMSAPSTVAAATMPWRLLAKPAFSLSDAAAD